MIFAQIFKVDEARQEVWGRATQEVVDKAGEIFDYETSKPLFRAWSDGFAADTDGKSLGNIRSMHGKVAAGKVIAIEFNDAEKAIDIGTKIVDKNEWEKVMEGVHTGFSIGGSYVKKWKDGDATRFTANPSEISLVDSPCVPTAKFFDVLKADGVIEKRAFAKADTMAICAAACAAQAASAIECAKVCLDSIPVMGGNGAYVLGYCIEECARCARVCIECAEACGGSPNMMAMAAGLNEQIAKMEQSGLLKVSAKTLAKAQAIHDHATSMGASCGPASQEKAMTPEDLQKMEDLSKKMDEMTAALAKADEEKAALLDRIAKLEAQPEPVKGFSKAADDTDKGVPMSLPEMEKAADAIEDPTERFKAHLNLAYLQGPK